MKNFANHIGNVRILTLVAVVFLILTAAAGVGIAKYTSISSLLNSAEVAEFDITSSKGVFDEDDNLLDPSDPDDFITYRFPLGSKSEVAVAYDIIISHVPVGLSPSIENYTDVENITVVNETREGTVEIIAHTYTFPNVGVFEPVPEEDASISIIFKCSADEQFIDSRTVFNNITVEAVATQLD